MPEVSIIVPVYNVEKFIGRCIESVQGQTMTEWELILVDDCSQDNSREVILRYAKDDDRIILLTSDENHGPMVARRRGDNVAKGRFITYCDGDDMLPNNAIKLLLEEAVISDADIVSGNYKYIKTDGCEIVSHSTLKYGNNGQGFLKSQLKHEIPHVLWSKLFKSELVKKEDYRIVDHMTNGEDAYFLYQMIPHVKKIVQIPDVVYLYMQNMNSSSQRRYSENALDNMMLMNSMRVSLIESFPHLKKDIHCYVSDFLTSLIIEGYNEDGLLDKLMEKHKLKKYCSNRMILASHSLVGAAILIYKKQFAKHIE